MFRFGVRIAAIVLSVSALAATSGTSFADPPKRGGGGAPAARPAAPPRPAMAAPRPAPQMSRPAPQFARPSAPAMQRPAFAPRQMPQRPAMMQRPSAPRFAAPQRTFQHRSVQRPDFRRTPSVVQRSMPSRVTTRQDRRQERVQLRAQQRQQIQQNAQSRQAGQSQTRSDRLQQRIQRLQAQNPRNARERRAVQRELARDQRLLSREQRTQQRLGIAPAAAVGAAAAAAQRQQALAPNNNNAALRNAARGRFAGRFLNNQNANPAALAQRQAAWQARRNGWAPRESWRRGHRAVFVAWLGPVFWPYAYSDIFDYTFWPAAYDDGYFAYAYDDFVDTVFWGPDSQYIDSLAYADEPGMAPIGGGVGGPIRETTGARPLRDRAPVSEQTVRALCGDPEKGVTAWPFADIEKAVQPTAEQGAALEDMKQAAQQAAAAFKDSCGGTYAMTPPGRLQAMMNRVSSTLEAVRIVKPALEKFYNSLSDEQKARFNEVGPAVARNTQASQPAPANQQEANAQANACREPKPGLTNLPIDRVGEVVRPAGAQKDALDRLGGATEKAVDILQAACPDDVPQTPPGRLDAMEKRLDAMLQAAKTVQQPLADFYAKLSSEQKARFNTMGQTASR